MNHTPIEGSALSSIESSNAWHWASARLTAEGIFTADIFFYGEDTVLGYQPAPLAFYLMCRLISHLVTAQAPRYVGFESIGKNLHCYLDVVMHVIHVDEDFSHPTFTIEVTLKDLERAREKYEKFIEDVVSRIADATLV